MKVNEIISEDTGYYEKMIALVQDILSQLIARNIQEISTENFQELMAREGHNISVPELIVLIDKSDFASSVDGNTIRPANQLPRELVNTEPKNKDLSTTANIRSMNNIKARGK